MRNIVRLTMTAALLGGLMAIAAPAYAQNATPAPKANRPPPPGDVESPNEKALESELSSIPPEAGGNPPASAPNVAQAANTEYLKKKHGVAKGPQTAAPI